MTREEKFEIFKITLSSFMKNNISNTTIKYIVEEFLIGCEAWEEIIGEDETRSEQ